MTLERNLVRSVRNVVLVRNKVFIELQQNTFLGNIHLYTSLFYIIVSYTCFWTR